MLTKAVLIQTQHGSCTTAASPYRLLRRFLWYRRFRLRGKSLSDLESKRNCYLAHVSKLLHTSNMQEQTMLFSMGCHRHQRSIKRRALVWPMWLISCNMELLPLLWIDSAFSESGLARRDDGELSRCAGLGSSSCSFAMQLHVPLYKARCVPFSIACGATPTNIFFHGQVHHLPWFCVCADIWLQTRS